MNQTWAYLLNHEGKELCGSNNAVCLDGRMLLSRQIQFVRDYIQNERVSRGNIGGFYIEVGEGPNRLRNKEVHREVSESYHGKVRPQSKCTFRRMTPEKEAKAWELWENHYLCAEIAKAVDVNQATIHKFLRKKGVTDLNRKKDRTKRKQIEARLLSGERDLWRISVELGAHHNYVITIFRNLRNSGELEHTKNNSKETTS